MTWPHDIPKPSQTVIDDMACAAINGGVHAYPR
jgi:hypothetical protein